MRRGCLAIGIALTAGMLTGCLGAGSDENDRGRAQAMLASALSDLGQRSAVSYRGAMPGAASSTRADVDVTSHGVAFGTVRIGADRLRVMVVDGKRFVRADAAFWAAHGKRPKTFGRRWVQIGPSTIAGLPPLRTPSQLGDWLRRTTDRDAVAASKATVGGVPAIRLDLGDSTLFVRPARPHGVLRLQLPEEPTGATRTATALAPHLALAGPPGGDLVDLSEPDVSDYDELLQDVASQVAKLATAANAQVRFAQSPRFTCAGSTCVASTTVTAIAVGDGVVTGTVDATLTATMTAQGMTQVCTSGAVVAVNTPASLTCTASFAFRPVPGRTGVVTIPVRGGLLTIAKARVSIARIQRAVQRQRRGNQARWPDPLTDPRGLAQAVQQRVISGGGSVTTSKVGRNRCEDAGQLADRLPQGSGRQNYVVYWALPAPPEEVVRYVGISRSLESRCRSHSEPYRSENLATLQLPPLELNEARSVEEALIAHFGIVNELATFGPRVGQLMNARHEFDTRARGYCSQLELGRSILRNNGYAAYAIARFTKRTHCPP